MTIAKFERVVVESAFAFRELELVGIGRIDFVTRIPGVRELLTSSVRAELTPRTCKTEAGVRSNNL
jgi:hypothetical protein